MVTPEEIVAEINRINREALLLRDNGQPLTHDEILEMMDSAAMRGFQFGSNVAISMVQGALFVQLARAEGGKANSGE